MLDSSDMPTLAGRRREWGVVVLVVEGTEAVYMEGTEEEGGEEEEEEKAGEEGEKTGRLVEMWWSLTSLR